MNRTAARHSVGRERAPPLALWGALAGIVTLLFAALALLPRFVPTPWPETVDRRFFVEQLSWLDRQRAQARGPVAPLSIVFVGTSRIKNVVLNPHQVARSARAAGVERPVISTFIAINWGGFERLDPVMRKIQRNPPDVVAIMPELLYQEFRYTARIRLLLYSLQSRLWLQEYNLFGDREYREPICEGKINSPRRRARINANWVVDGPTGKGPRAAQAAVRELARGGVVVLVAEMPITPQLQAEDPRADIDTMVQRSGMAGIEGVHPVKIGRVIPESAFCDWSHIDPDRANLWQTAFFKAAAPHLNRLD